MGEPSDVWAIGVCAYTALSGDYPFRGKSQGMQAEMRNTLAGRMNPWAGPPLSHHAKAFVESILSSLDPIKRPTIPHLLASPWLDSSVPHVPPMVALDAVAAGLPVAAPAWWTAHDGSIGVTDGSIDVAAAVTVPPGVSSGQHLAVLEPVHGVLVTVPVPAGYFPGMQFPASVTVTTTTAVVTHHSPSMSYPTAIPLVQAHAVGDGEAEAKGGGRRADVALPMATPDWNLLPTGSV